MTITVFWDVVTHIGTNISTQLAASIFWVETLPENEGNQSLSKCHLSKGLHGVMYHNTFV